MIDLFVCRLRNIQYFLTDHQASSRAAPIPIELLQRASLFAQIFPSVHLVEAAVDFKVVISVTATSIFVGLELLATVILTHVVRIGLLYAALRAPLSCSKPSPFVVLRVRLDRPSPLVEPQLLRLQVLSPVCVLHRPERNE